MSTEASPADDGRRPAPPVRRIDAACDRFEAGWRAGREPRIEDLLAVAEAADHPALLRELLALEIDLRRGRGEHPAPADYRDRFPGQADLIAAAFAAADTGPGRSGPQPGRSLADAGHNLLFGLLALQNNFVSREALLGAFAAWVADRSRTLGRILRDTGALDDARQALLEALVAEHLKLHGDDPERSLAVLSSIGSVRGDLERLGDPGLHASLAATGPGPGESNSDGRSAAADASSSRRAGERFRILRFHREGGLGRVYVARDEELGRDVALKEIRPDKAAEAHLRGRFVLEAEINGGLEHPGIVPVYSLGAYDDGRPFYAMRFVEGDSLKEAIEAYHREHPRPDPGAVEFRRLLGRFVDVCEAIAFAHSKGVLHRDLKPHNVMLGRYGETLLIDWGLAKATGRREPAGAAGAVEATLVPPSGSEQAPTLGVLGSPPYMSPEQAVGATDSLGPATDVYGLGAILFALLTGEAPVEGTTTEEILDQSRRGVIRSPRSLNPNIPRALEAVCLKALALQPGDRYPTALALAEEVEHWLADEPVSAYQEPFSARARRWRRRHRIATAAGMWAGIVLLGALGIGYRREMNYAANLARENRRTEEREALAIDAVRRFRDAVVMNRDLKDRADLKPLRESLLKEPLNFFRTLRDQMQSTDHTRPEALYRLAHANWELASTVTQIGNQADALRAYEEVRSILERLAREKPAGTTFLRDLAAIHNNVGALQRDLGQPAAAIESFRKALAIRERLAPDDAAGTEFEDVRIFRARIHDNIGKLQDQRGQPTTALNSFQKALVIWEELSRETPALRNHVADTLGNIGNQQRALGQTTAALASYQEALVILKGLVQDKPANPKFQQSLAAIDSCIGLLRSEQGQPATALESLEQALGIQERLVRDEPTITRLQSDLSNTYNIMGGVQRVLGQPAAALESFRKAAVIRERLSRDNPAAPEYQLELANSYNNIGVMQMALNRRAAALDSFQKAMMVFERLAQDNPTNIKFQYSLAGSHHNIGVLRMSLGQAIASLESLQRALVIFERLERAQPSNAQFRGALDRCRAFLAASHTIIGVRRIALGQTIASLISIYNSIYYLYKIL